MKGQKGFTLIELMVVVVIIGILAAIAIPNFIAMEKRAKEASVKANMNTLNLALEDYATTSGGLYPAYSDPTQEPLFPSHLANNVMPNNPYTSGPTQFVGGGAQTSTGPLAYATTTIPASCSGATTEGELSYYFSPATGATQWALTGCNDTGIIMQPGSTTQALVVHN